MPDQSDALKPAGGGGRSFLGVRRMKPHDDGVHLFDDDGLEVGIVRYGEARLREWPRDVVYGETVVGFNKAPRPEFAGRNHSGGAASPAVKSKYSSACAIATNGAIAAKNTELTTLITYTEAGETNKSKKAIAGPIMKPRIPSTRRQANVCHHLRRPLLCSWPAILAKKHHQAESSLQGMPTECPVG